jgi:TM2 domain-containing membrane protein YozV
MKRSPAAAVWLSLIPGAGHIYAGETSKGIVLVLLVFSAIQVTAHGAGPFGIVIPFLWLYAMIDAHRAAARTNQILAAGGSISTEGGPALSTWWGYLLIAFGVIFGIENFFPRLDVFEKIWRLWPLALIALGVAILRRKPVPFIESAPLPPPPAPEEPSARSSETENV